MDHLCPTDLKGVYEIKYQIPSFDRTGKINGYKKEVYIKSVYDPSIISESKLIESGSQAAANGYSNAMKNGKREYRSSAGGVKFQIYVDPKTGEVTNYFPIGKQ